MTANVSTDAIRQESIGGQTTTSSADRELSELIELHERADWSEIPGVSTLEAATWTQRLDEARAELREAPE